VKEPDDSVSGMFSGLLNSIRELRFLTITQAPQHHTPFQNDADRFPKLLNAKNSLSTTRSVQLTVDTEALLRKWHEIRSKGQFSDLSARDYKRLCWVPEILNDPEFRSLVQSGSIPTTLPSLRGLLYSYHELFNTLANNEDFEEHLRSLIIKRNSASSTITQWKRSIDCLIGKDAPNNLAKYYDGNWKSPELVIEELGISLNTEFSRQFASVFALRLSRQFDPIPLAQIPTLLRDIIRSSLVKREVYKTALENIILSRKANNDEDIQATLLEFLLKTPDLGDPRIYPERWVDIRDEAKATVTQWLSREDINLFFELLFRDRNDRHGRKSFWLRYVNKVSRSRALLCRDDIKHHSVRLREMREKGRTFGSLVGAQPSSAFILDFGNIVAVEFSEIGNACYLYSKKDFAKICDNFWAPQIPFRDLKNRKLANARITRSQSDWRTATRNLLSRHGVRSG